MGNIAVWLMGLSVPLVKKVLVALGIGALTYAGLSTIGSQVQAAVVSSWGAMGSTTLAILSIAGVTQSVGIILSALSARIALIAVGRIGKVSA